MTKDEFFNACRNAHRDGPVGAPLQILEHGRSLDLAAVIEAPYLYSHYSLYSPRGSLAEAAAALPPVKAKFERWLAEFNSKYTQASTAPADTMGPYMIRPLIWVCPAELYNEALQWKAAGAMGSIVHIYRDLTVAPGLSWRWQIIGLLQPPDTESYARQRHAMQAAEGAYRRLLRAALQTSTPQPVIEEPRQRQRELDIQQIGS